jgi:hypothetical protein
MVKFEYRLVGIDLRHRDLSALQEAGDEGFEALDVMNTSNVNNYVILMQREVELSAKPASKKKEAVKKAPSKKDQQKIKEGPAEKLPESIAEE